MWSLIVIPFAGVLLGLGWRTFVPYLLVAFAQSIETSEWPKFEKKFWVPPAATFVVETLGLIGLVLTTPGVFESIGSMKLLASVAFGMAGQSVVRDVQKFIEAWRGA